MITHPNLSTKLDTITEDLSEKLRTWRNTTKIFRWCRQNDLLSESTHALWMKNHPVDESVRMYLVRDEANRAVGVGGLTDIDLINQRAEFSLYIAPEFQGRGLGSDALKLLCFHGFNAYPLRVIWGESFESNPAIKKFEEIGFKIEGVRRDFYYRDGQHINAVLFSIKKDELKIW